MCFGHLFVFFVSRGLRLLSDADFAKSSELQISADDADYCWCDCTIIQ